MGKTGSLTERNFWIRTGGSRGFYTVFARTDGPEGHITAFTYTRDMPGVSTGPHEDKDAVFVQLDDHGHFGQRKSSAEKYWRVGKALRSPLSILNSGRTGLGGGSSAG